MLTSYFFKSIFKYIHYNKVILECFDFTRKKFTFFFLADIVIDKYTVMKFGDYFCVCDIRNCSHMFSF